MVVTPSFIPVSVTQVPDMDLSLDEGSKEVLKDSDDDPVMKTRVFDTDDELEFVHISYRN